LSSSITTSFRAAQLSSRYRASWTEGLKSELAELLASERFTFQSTSARHGPEICTQHAKARKSVSRSTDPALQHGAPLSSRPEQHAAQVNQVFNLCVVQ
jgi:hypothetical protein